MNLLAQYQRQEEEARDRGLVTPEPQNQSPTSNYEEEDNQEENKIDVFGIIVNILILVAIVVLIIFLTSFISKVDFKVKDVIGKYTKFNCEKDQSILDFKASVEQLHIPIPLYADFENQVWIENSGWTQVKFQSEISEIMQNNFTKNSSFKSKLDFSNVIGHQTEESSKLLADPVFLKEIKLKFMDFVSSKHALLSFDYNSMASNEKYSNHVQSFKQCKSRIEELRSEILKRLGDDSLSRSEILSLEEKNKSLYLQLQTIDQKINLKNKHLNEALDKIEGEISTEEDRLRAKRTIEMRIERLEIELNKLLGYVPGYNQNIDTTKSSLLKNKGDLSDNINELSRLLRKRDSLNNDLLFLRKELNLLETNRDIQQIASKLGSGCDEARIDKINNKYKQRMGEEDSLKELLGDEEADQDILKELNIVDQDKEAYQAIMKSYINLRRIGKSFDNKKIDVQIKEFEAKRDSVLADLLEIENKIKALKQKGTSLGLTIESIQSSLSSYIEGSEKNQTDIDVLRQSISELRSKLSPSNINLDLLRKNAQTLRDQLKQAEGSWLLQKMEINKKISEIKLRIIELNAGINGSDSAIAKLVRELNYELNNCKRNEIMIQKFESEYQSVIRKLKEDKTKVNNLKQELHTLLDRIEGN